FYGAGECKRARRAMFSSRTFLIACRAGCGEMNQIFKCLYETTVCNVPDCGGSFERLPTRGGHLVGSGWQSRGDSNKRRFAVGRCERWTFGHCAGRRDSVGGLVEGWIGAGCQPRVFGAGLESGGSIDPSGRGGGDAKISRCDAGPSEGGV